MDVHVAECQQCGKRFSPRIGEQFCSPAHAREYFSKAARSRDNRKSDNRPGLMTARHRVMELLRLPAAPEPQTPPEAPLSRTQFRPTFRNSETPRKTEIVVAPLERTDPLVVKLPGAESLSVEEGLAALGKSLAAKQAAAEESAIPAPQDDMLPLAMPSVTSAVAGRLPAASVLAGPEFSLKPQSLPARKRSGVTPVKVPRAVSVDFFRLAPRSAGARISKSPPLPVALGTVQSAIPQSNFEEFDAALRFDRIFALEPFRRNLANPVLPTGQHETLSRSGQHLAGNVRWEFLHELPDDARRMRQPLSPASNVNTNVNRDSVAPWIVPVRPIHPEFLGDLRPFDWAQLIARLADFEDQTTAEKTSKHNATTTRMAAVARRKQERLRAIPVLGPVIHFWQTQTWAVRGLALAIPVLGFIAVKPSLDGSLREPVVLAKEMPRPVSTVIRREPAKELLAVRGGGSAPPASGTALPIGGTLPPVPDGLPMPKATPEPPRETSAAATAKPKLVPERATKPPGAMPSVANVEPKLDKFDQILLSRAAVELADDFSFGLDSWEARSNAVQWTYDPTGFVRPHGLAIYRPSLNLTDYSVEFLAKIDNSAISWVVRAQDLNNYMVVKMVQRGGGPLPRYTVMHYPVINGREGARIEHPLPLNLYKDTLFRIRMDIRGSNYAVLVQDSVVDSWSDERFPIGGVGFFTGIGEEARIRWVQVTYQNDFIGKLCAWLAPKTQVQ